MSTNPQPTPPYTSFLDYNGWYSTGYADNAGLAQLPSGTAVSSTDTIPLFNVALVLGRANDPTAPGGLLSENWATRQQQIQTMVENGTLWSTYGASEQDYNGLMSFLNDNDITVMGLSGTDGYTTSMASRTIWVQVTGANFNTLFGNEATLYRVSDGSYYWASPSSATTPANLILPQYVQGMWIDHSIPSLKFPPSTQTPVTLEPGPQGEGNASPNTNQEFPQELAALYHFPLAGTNAGTPAIGILESALGASPPPPPTGQSQQSFEQLLSTYRVQAGLDPFVTVIGVQPNGPSVSSPTIDPTGERSLDVGIATTINPQSTLILYAGSGTGGVAQSEPFTTYFQAIWDTTYNPGVLSSSERFDTDFPSPDSPFMFAVRELFIDAALRNMSVFSSSGDGGSGYELANGLPNVSNNRASPYAVMVGGTSLSTVAIAQTDPTLSAIYADATTLDSPDRSATLWHLIAGGLTRGPTPGDDSWFIEAVWNAYVYDTQDTPPQINPGYEGNNSSNAGFDFTQPAPWYQSALEPFPSTPEPPTPALQGRAVPDVVAPAGGDMHFTVPTPEMYGQLHPDEGTSAATPFWASLAVQINALLWDQGFPASVQLGYWNDLLYMAAAIAPGAFNDVSIGNNKSSYLTGDDTPGPYVTPGADGHLDGIVPTGAGYEAEPGYDVASGLGSPNGLLLARAISDVAHSQMYYGSTPGVLQSQASGGWASSVAQDLLVQVTSKAAASVHVTVDGATAVFDNPAATEFAWTAQLAQQVLQSDFDESLVTLFDGARQGTLRHAILDAGDSLAVSIDGNSALAYSARLTNAFGFDDFQTSRTDGVRVARPVAVAEGRGTPDDPSEFAAVVRIRQDGTDNVEVTLYRVDDLTGAIGNLQPGDTGYRAAAQARAYHTLAGDASIAGPGYGKFTQVVLPNVNAGDLVALKLENLSTGDTFWGFTQGNETVDGQKVAHLWNYGLNTYGFEDRYGGGDRDYNDVIVGIDFNSASGSGWTI